MENKTKTDTLLQKPNKTKQTKSLLVKVQNLTEDVPTRWRDLLFYIKKGANWSFPLGVEGIKSDFIRFMCETLYYIIQGGKKNKKKQPSQIKRTVNLSVK